MENDTIPETVLQVNKLDWKAALSPDLVTKLENPIKSIISVVNDRIAETVFFSVVVETQDANPETLMKAYVKYIVPDLEKLNQHFTVLGALSEPSFIELVPPRPPEVLAIEGWEARWEAIKNIKTPPHNFAVFCFPVVDSGAYGPEAAVVTTNLRERMEAVGLDYCREGEVGRKVTI